MTAEVEVASSPRDPPPSHRRVRRADEPSVENSRNQKGESGGRTARYETMKWEASQNAMLERCWRGSRSS